MKRIAIVCAALIGAIGGTAAVTAGAPAWGAEFTLGFLTDGGDFADDVAQAAHDWAAERLSADRLAADGNGGFTRGGAAQTLDQYAALWMHHSASNATPDAFRSAETVAAVLEYLDAGGALFLSAQAVRYAADLEVESNGVPRVFQPLGKGPPEIGVRAAEEQENHPIFAGFDAGEPIYLCSMDQPGFTADFHGFGGLDGTLIATKTRGGGAGAGERPIVEYHVGSGRIMTLGHHNAVYTDDQSDEGGNLRQLTENILGYLAENSAFFSVDPSGKMSVVWGGLKAR